LQQMTEIREVELVRPKTIIGRAPSWRRRSLAPMIKRNGNEKKEIRKRNWGGVEFGSPSEESNGPKRGRGAGKINTSCNRREKGKTSLGVGNPCLEQSLYSHDLRKRESDVRLMLEY